MVRRRWRSALVLGVLVAVVLGFRVIRTEPATPGPQGVALVWAVLWRGVAYGAVDGLLLSAFPILAVFAAAGASDMRRRRSGTVLVGAAAMLASLVMATVYHPATATSARRCWPGPSLQTSSGACQPLSPSTRSAHRSRTPGST